MISITQIKSLGDMRTTISTHARSAPRQQGSTYLEVYLLDKERQRLETELAMLAKRQRRVEARLGEIRPTIEKLRGEGPNPGESSVPPGAAAAAHRRDPRQWRNMTIGY
jgi:hypothetical protein